MTIQDAIAQMAAGEDLSTEAMQAAMGEYFTSHGHLTCSMLDSLLKKFSRHNQAYPK